MGKYFVTQIKRMVRILPFVLCVVVILFGGMSVAYSGIMESFGKQDEQKQFAVGMVGTADDQFLQMGLAAVQSIESLQFSIEVVPDLTEQQAMEQLRSGVLTAYVVFPEGFMEAALSGELKTLDFVTTTGAASIVSIIKEEFTSLISNIILAGERGSFGISAALRDYGYWDIAGEATYELSLEYVELLLSRDQLYQVQELGITDGLGFDGYLMCGLCVVFLLLVSLPFAPVFVRRDMANPMLLLSKGTGSGKQVAAEALSYFAGMVLVLAVLLSAIGIFGSGTLLNLTGWKAFVVFLPVIVFVTAFGFFVFELSESLITGVLLHFALSVALSFISGCMYPIYFFPESVQKAAVYLPTSMARSQLSVLITGEPAGYEWAVLLSLSALLFVLSALVRRHKIAQSGR